MRSTQLYFNNGKPLPKIQFCLNVIKGYFFRWSGPKLIETCPASVAAKFESVNNQTNTVRIEKEQVT